MWASRGGLLNRQGVERAAVGAFAALKTQNLRVGQGSLTEPLRPEPASSGPLLGLPRFKVSRWPS
jgi:hypothetical protein